MRFTTMRTISTLILSSCDLMKFCIFDVIIDSIPNHMKKGIPL